MAHFEAIYFCNVLTFVLLNLFFERKSVKDRGTSFISNIICFDYPLEKTVIRESTNLFSIFTRYFEMKFQTVFACFKNVSKHHSFPSLLLKPCYGVSGVQENRFDVTKPQTEILF